MVDISNFLRKYKVSEQKDYKVSSDRKVDLSDNYQPTVYRSTSSWTSIVVESKEDDA